MAFDAVALPSSEKRQMALSLLEEFGARNLREQGAEIVHSCLLPFGNHSNGDRNPSASLNYEKLTYACFVCGGGGLLWFLATMRGGTGVQAREWLTERTGLGGVQELGALLAYLDAIQSAPASSAPPHIPRYAASVLDPWRFLHPYLTEMRRIPAANLVAHDVCWNPQENRIIIPHFWQGALVGWQARRLGADGPKYQSTPEFPKRHTLFNFDSAQPDVVVVESPMSVIARTHQAHLEATFGAEVTPQQCDLLLAHRGRIVLWFDNDPAGWWATESVGRFLADRTVVWVVDSDLDADPADLDDATFRRYLDERVVPWSVWQRPAPEALVRWERPDEEVRHGKGAA